jgi:uncharacterized protein YaiI (UPF0178 family)
MSGGHPAVTDMTDTKPIVVYVDADACPVKQEVYRVAERFVGRGTAISVVVVSNSPIAVPREYLSGVRPDGKPDSTFPGRTLYVQRIVVGGGMDEADNYIAERAGRGDVVITADVPLAARAVKAGAEALAPNGKPFTEAAIGMTLATRNLMSDLRSAGAITSGPRPFAPQDRSRFLSGLDAAITRLMRAGFGKGPA